MSRRRRSSPALPTLGPSRHRWLRRVLTLIGIVTVLAAGSAVLVFARSPSVDDAEQRIATQLRAHGGVDTGLPSPVLVGKAAVAVEDRRFYRHHGIDTLSLARAITTTLGGGTPQGGDTITEQLAKVLYGGDDDHSVGGRLRVMALAVKLEDRYAKAQILEMYLNAIYYGDGQYGVAQASQIYFAKLPAALDWAEASLLAGLPQSPTPYDPTRHFAAARRRQQIVLRALVRTLVLRPAQADAAYAELTSLQN